MRGGSPVVTCWLIPDSSLFDAARDPEVWKHRDGWLALPAAECRADDARRAGTLVLQHDDGSVGQGDACPAASGDLRGIGAETATEVQQQGTSDGPASSHTSASPAAQVLVHEDRIGILGGRSSAHEEDRRLG